MTRFRKVCCSCGSANVGHDAYARWSEEDQRWELGDYYDSSFCSDCGDEDCIVDEEIKNDT